MANCQPKTCSGVGLPGYNATTGMWPSYIWLDECLNPRAHQPHSVHSEHVVTNELCNVKCMPGYYPPPLKG
jgi:hypothetical protein